MDEAEATGASAPPAVVAASVAVPVMAALIVAVMVPQMAAGYAACAAILIAGAAVIILWTPDEPVSAAPRRLRASSWTTALVAAPLPGLGFGTYWSAAPALLTEVPSATAARAKDLGLINIAYNLPLVVGPLVAGVVVD